MTGSPQQFCLRWNNHQSNIVSVFEHLFHSEAFVDVTLAVEGMSIKAHKVVLSACSPFFQAVLTSHPDTHPIVILNDVRYMDMRDLLDFMYRGEVSIDQDNLSDFLRVAESLRIKGLTDVNEEKRSETTSAPPPFLLSQQESQQQPNVTNTPGVISTASILSHSDIPALKRPPLSPTCSFGSSKRRREQPPKISGEDSEGEAVWHSNATQGGSTTDMEELEESKTELESKDVKVEVEELGIGKEEFQEDVLVSNETEGRNADSAGTSEDLGREELKVPKEEPDHTRESPGSEWTPTVAPIRLRMPAKRRRGRPSSLPRQPQCPSKWPPLLPKPSNSSSESARSEVSLPIMTTSTCSMSSSATSVKNTQEILSKWPPLLPKPSNSSIESAMSEVSLPIMNTSTYSRSSSATSVKNTQEILSKWPPLLPKPSNSSIESGMSEVSLPIMTTSTCSMSSSATAVNNTQEILSKWPPLLPKPSNPSIESGMSEVSLPIINAMTTSTCSMSSSATTVNNTQEISPFFLTPTVSVFPTPLTVSSFDITANSLLFQDLGSIPHFQ